MKLKPLTYVVLPLILGYILYQLRPLGNGWIDNLSIRGKESTVPLDLPDWLIYNMVDGLWAFALTSLVLIIWKNNASKSKWLWLFVTFLLVISVELLQKFEIMEGTFDWLDLVFNLVGYFISLLIFTNNEKIRA